MNTSPQALDKVFLALGQTVYVSQLFEAVMLDVLATANELLDGTGDGTKFQASIEFLSRKTLGQLLHGLRSRADIRADVEARLDAGLKARNFVIHHFAQHVGDDLGSEGESVRHQQTLYEKCGVIMAANDTALAILHALGELQSQQSRARISELKKAADALRNARLSSPSS